MVTATNQKIINNKINYLLTRINIKAMLRHHHEMLSLALFATASVSAYAAVVPVEDARQLANDFFASANKANTDGNTLELAYTAGSESKPLYYVFNAKDGKGFVIVSAEDCTTPVLGFSFDNPYIVSKVPDAMKWMMDGVEKEIKAASKLQKPMTPTVRRSAARAAAAEATEKLLNTPSWSQEAPFNDAIPGHPLVGCVGTAMASIMKYYNYPAQGTGSYDGVSFDVAYDWDNMRSDNYRSGYSQAEADAVATLVYHAAKSINTQFGMSGSSAYEVRVPAALSNYFNYDPGVSFKKRAEVSSQAAWDKIVKDEIDAGRPVLYCGQDVTVGHAFICDGYRAGGYFHFNWGWGGAANGYFLSTSLNPSVSQAHNFNNLQTIIYNIKPATGANKAWSTIHITADGGQPGIGTDLTDLTSGKAFTVRVGNMKNLAYTNFSGKIAVALFGADGTMKSLLSEPAGFNLQSMATLGSGYVTLRNCSLKGGATAEQGDMVRIVTSDDNGTTWLPVAGELYTINEIPAIRTAADYFAINFPASVTGATFSGEDKVIRGWDYSFNVAVANAAEDVVTVKANGYILTPGANNTYSIANVKEDQEIAILVQKASEVRAKRSIWVENPGELATLIPESETGTIKDLTLFGSIDARDFEFMRSKMKLNRLDISSVYIAANGVNQANAIPKQAFQGQGQLTEVLLPNNINRINNAAFRSCGITSIKIPAGVKTYEYNIFLNAWRLRDVWVGRETAEFINWCVFAGTSKGDIVLHVPNEKAVNNYKNKENWSEIATKITVDPIPAMTDFAFAVMDVNAVKFDCDTPNGRLQKGTKVTFTAEHIADNDDRMDVYANNIKLTPDAEGRYNTTVNGNTIIHFDLVKPTPCNASPSPWQLTNHGGTVGLFTDAVNVIPGINFDIRANALYIPADYSSMFWAAVLTDKDGNIKEFISPITVSSGASGDGLKMTIKCCVKESTVREGNLIRLATSFNKNTWSLVGGKSDDVIAALPALNNQTPVYNFTFPEGLEDKANLSGVVKSAVRGRDLTFKITPKTASHTLVVAVNGDTIVNGGKTFSYSFIAKQDMNFDIKVVPPVSYTEATVVLKEGEHLYLSGDEGISNWGEINYATAEKFRNIKKLKIVGKIDYYDFNLFRQNYWIAANIKYLDLSEAQFVCDRDKNAGTTGLDNVFPARALYNNELGGCHIEEIILPPTLVQFDSDAFKGCSRLKEIRLPENLRVWSSGKVVSSGVVRDLTRGGILDDVFLGCNSLETIYVPCKPGANGNIGHWYYMSYHSLKTGLPDNKKVTVVVPAEHLEAYKTPRTKDDYPTFDWSNGWEAGKFNIVSEYPVYSLEYDAASCFVTDAEIKDNVSRAASFLKDNIALDSLDRKLYIGVKSNLTEGRPEGMDAYDAAAKVKVYDNDILLADDAVAADGSVTVTYWNPNKHADKSGNHTIKVVRLLDVKFNCSSELFTIAPEEIRNNEDTMGASATEFETWNYYDALAPVLENVTEGSTVRFTVNMDAAKANGENIEARVKAAKSVITPDEDGYYSINVADSDMTVEIFAVPVNGATLNPEEFNSIDVKEAVDITSIALEGEITPEILNSVKESFTSLEELDLSDMNGDVPAGTFNGMTTLSTITLPEAATTIEANTFDGCSNLTTVTVPQSISTIGDGAFNGCSSLTSITLTGVDAIGAGAFSGCDNITSINLNAATASSSSAMRAPAASRAAGFNDKAFEGVNPNCLIILGENVAVPSAAGNYIATTIGTVTEEVDGVTTQREGRIYTSAGNISLRAGYPLEIANKFTLGDNDEISLTAPANSADAAGAWSPLVVPFNVETVALASDNLPLNPSLDWGEDDQEGNYTAITFDTDEEIFVRQENIEANKPYLMRLGAASGEVRLSAANNAVIPATPDHMSVSATGYDLVATYKAVEAAPATTYVLNEEGNAFVRTATEQANDTATVAVAPFSVYAVSNDGAEQIEIDLGDDPTTGIDSVDGDIDLSFGVEDDALVIYSAKERQTAIYTVDGRLAGAITLAPGRNVITGISRGIYIIEGRKFSF